MKKKDRIKTQNKVNELKEKNPNGRTFEEEEYIIRKDGIYVFEEN